MDAARQMSRCAAAGMRSKATRPPIVVDPGVDVELGPADVVHEDRGQHLGPRRRPCESPVAPVLGHLPGQPGVGGLRDRQGAGGVALVVQEHRRILARPSSSMQRLRRHRASRRAPRCPREPGPTIGAPGWIARPMPPWYPSAVVQFGTSGWRGIIGREITFRKVRIVTQALINLLREDRKTVERIVVGYDTRMLSEKFARHRRRADRLQRHPAGGRPPRRPVAGAVVGRARAQGRRRHHLHRQPQPARVQRPQDLHPRRHPRAQPVHRPGGGALPRARRRAGTTSGCRAPS